MKIALVIPRTVDAGKPSFYDYRFYQAFLFTRKYFSYLLAAPVLASLTPPGHEVRIFDENVEEIDYGWGADLAGITVRTMFAPRAYAISERFRKRGVKTVLGGIHVSMRPDEALGHGDAVVVGEAEGLWPVLVRDVEEGALQRVYRAGGMSDLAASPPTSRTALARANYFADIVQTTKGCPFDCEFCSVTAFDGRRLRHKSVDRVVREIEELGKGGGGFKKKSIFFADDNIVADRKYARELFNALRPHSLNWSCQGSIDISRREDLLGLMKESGCGAILVGLESISERNLAAMGKKVNLRHDYLEAIGKIQAHGIMVHGSFVLGYDFDTTDSFDELVSFIDEAGLLMPLINILTPFPGTRLYSRLKQEGRILHEDWNRYDGQSVVFQPALMAPEELYEGFGKVLREVYSFAAISRKLRIFWERDFWARSNRVDPIGLAPRLLFAARLLSMLSPSRPARSKFLMKTLPNVFRSRVRVSTILTLLAYNDFATSLAPEGSAKGGGSGK